MKGYRWKGEEDRGEELREKWVRVHVELGEDGGEKAGRRCVCWLVT